MFQEIITYLILALTVASLILNIRKFFSSTENTTGSGKCTGCSGACEIKDFKEFHRPGILKPEHYKLKL